MKPATQIEVVVRAVLRNGPRILLAQMKGYDFWFLPGGHVEVGESAPDALHRELRDELGIEVHVDQLIAVSENRYVLDDEERHEVNLVFLARVESRPEHSLDPRLEFRWFQTDALINLDIRPKALATVVRYGPAGNEMPLFSDDLGARKR
ncbi:NUDIX domain-containing protein [Arsenicicoccus piscis]|uniref:DNA mismatch repair protein MutT n=1 Tax=Arsenicicoccus piscis TaxID=673954 RepID=A0ABQ6HMG3_9MICO|nr:NUDIX domain-containing protein [Arsenicicoccus piscis]MCH8626782.1 NUDIX domain-containing protein [Arsenicicoccus piscis]MCH8628731.1 NUDIX domain-containing protein [Arsenicicoccus piscis]GMA19325.1 DNA mismatch repair protein MutT [Arsenicicoccus piscis]